MQQAMLAALGYPAEALPAGAGPGKRKGAPLSGAAAERLRKGVEALATREAELQAIQNARLELETVRMIGETTLAIFMDERTTYCNQTQKVAGDKVSSLRLKLKAHAHAHAASGNGSTIMACKNSEHVRESQTQSAADVRAALLDCCIS